MAYKNERAEPTFVMYNCDACFRSVSRKGNRDILFRRTDVMETSKKSFYGLQIQICVPYYIIFINRRGYYDIRTYIYA